MAVAAWQTDGYCFAQKLIAAGVELPKRTKRIVIDIQMNEPVTIYYSTLADQQVMDRIVEALAGMAAHETKMVEVPASPDPHKIPSDAEMYGPNGDYVQG